MDIILIPVSILAFIDQITKWLAKAKLTQTNYIAIIEEKLELMPVFNTGFAFGFKDHLPSYMLIVITLITLVVLYAVYKHDSKNKVNKIAFVFLFAGGIGNGFDRIVFQKVTDFIMINRFMAFNLADLYMLIGLMILINQYIEEQIVSY